MISEEGDGKHARHTFGQSSNISDRPEVLGAFVLPILLQQTNLGTVPAEFCMLSRVCKVWRAAVQQHSKGRLKITFAASSSSATSTAPDKLHKALSKLGSFAAWLNRFASCMFELHVSSDFWDAATAAAYSAVAEPLLASMFKAIAAQGNTGQQDLQLCSYRSDCAHGPMILAALPASLTQLTVQYGFRSQQGTICRSSNALSALTNLQRLELHSTHYVQAMLSSSCLSCLSSLTNLTSLSLECTNMVIASAIHLSHLPDSLQYLKLSAHLSFHGDDGSSRLHPSLGHLIKLTQLELDWCNDAESEVFLDYPQRFELPTQLQKLKLQPELHACYNITELQQLQHLHTWAVDGHMHAAQLQRLTALRQLEELWLQYDSLQRALPAAQFWQQLPVSSMEVEAYIIDPSEEVTPAEAALIAHGIGAVQSITRLVYHVPSNTPVCVFEQLSGLSTLKELELELEDGTDPSVVQRGAMHLTNLKQLTRLCLQRFYIGDMAAVAVACELTKLRHLSVVNCCIESSASWPAIGRLTSLTSLNLDVARQIHIAGQMLWLDSDAFFGHEQLLQLTRLSKLQYLTPIQSTSNLTIWGFSSELVNRFRPYFPELRYCQ